MLAIAGDEGKGFWCGLFVDGDYRPRFQHHRLTGPRSFEENPASLADVQVLCGYFGAAVVVEDVYEALSSHYYTNALDCHTATARSLGLPSWSVGMGYSRILDGSVPPEAGTPTKPPSCLADLRPSPNGSMTSRQPMRQSGRMDPPQPSEPFMAFYRSQALNVVIETLSYGGITRLCLIDRESRLLDVTERVERRDPELLDGCRLASGYREQIPMFAEALRKCAADVLAGDLQAISLEKNVERGFSLGRFSSRDERSRFLASLGPRLRSNVGRTRQGRVNPSTA